jgi:hypothetical protein
MDLVEGVFLEVSRAPLRLHPWIEDRTYCVGPDAREASGGLQLIKQPRRLGLGHTKQVRNKLGIGFHVLGEPVEEREGRGRARA